VAAAVAAAALALRIGRPDVAPPPRLELQISAPLGTALIYDVETIRFAVSPDGQQLAFIAAGPGAVRRVWMRPLATIEAKPVTGTDGASVVFWSPDGGSIGFVSGDKMKRLELASGAAVTICSVPTGIGIYATWSRRGEILFATINGEAIYRVSTAGGEATALVKIDPSRDEVRVAFPSFLPDGNRYLYLLRHRDDTSVLMLAEPGSAPRTVVPIESNAQYVEPGTLVFARGGALVAQSFDASTGKVAGEPVAIAASVRFFLTTAAAHFSTSPNGSLVFQSQNDRSRLAWLNRSGLEVGTVGSPGTYLDVRLAPSGRTALASRTLPATGTFDIWSIDLDRGTETRVTLNDIATEIEGIVVPGGEAMFFAGPTRAGALRLIRRDLRTGHDEPVVAEGRQMQGTDDVSLDGKRLAYNERTARGTFNLWTLPLTGPAVPARIRESAFNETRFRFAPDGDHYTYTSDESGRPEVYLARLSGGGKTIVSTGGGFDARWSRGGREIVYVAPDLRMMAVPVQTTPEVVLGKPTTLFAMTLKRWVSYDVSPDGERFLVVIPEIIAGEQPLTAFINMAASVERGRAPGS
jgi:Tol biopolymer transport system component